MKNICYPDGSPVRVGDIVWNNEGLNVRKVLQIVTPKETALFGVDGPGFFWTRYIGKSDLGVLGYESASNFQSEGVGLLSLPEKLCIQLLFHLLGKQIGCNIWDNDSYLYYPVLHPETREDGTIRWIWYLFFQRFCQVEIFQGEHCYRFDEDRYSFDLVETKMQDVIRGL